MEKWDAKPSKLTDEELYILKTKAEADRDNLFDPFREQTPYQKNLYRRAKAKCQIFISLTRILSA